MEDWRKQRIVEYCKLYKINPNTTINEQHMWAMLELLDFAPKGITTEGIVKLTDKLRAWIKGKINKWEASHPRPRLLAPVAVMQPRKPLLLPPEDHMMDDLIQFTKSDGPDEAPASSASATKRTRSPSATSSLSSLQSFALGNYTIDQYKRKITYPALTGTEKPPPDAAAAASTTARFTFPAGGLANPASRILRETTRVQSPSPPRSQIPVRSPSCGVESQLTGPAAAAKERQAVHRLAHEKAAAAAPTTLRTSQLRSGLIRLDAASAQEHASIERVLLSPSRNQTSYPLRIALPLLFLLSRACLCYKHPGKCISYNSPYYNNSADSTYPCYFCGIHNYYDCPYRG
ncbi:hypothetical protein LTR28_010687 [Elasticomyces elasticus]|nr:hypothetical protein LTR28_010687 [Elasticomyces elasticus]